jgi:hypothetical protein
VNDVSVRDGEAPALFVGDARGVLSVYATKPNANTNTNTTSSSGAVALTFGGTGIQKPEAVVDDALTTAAQNFTLARPQQKAHELVWVSFCWRVVTWFLWCRFFSLVFIFCGSSFPN